MQNTGSGKTVILATGGTIAGRADRAEDSIGYRAGELGIGALLAAVPPLQGLPLEAEQVAQVDSKDMDAGIWQQLARRCAHHLARDAVSGLVVTHGTDTLEETAWFLHRVLAPRKPLVLTAAMRPASALQADGPQNLLDAVRVARSPQAAGVVAVLAGTVHAAADLRKLHTTRIDAFGSGDAGPLARIDSAGLRGFREWPRGTPLGLDAIAADVRDWPWVAVLHNHAGADGREVQALRAAGVRGLVVAGTGNGTLSVALDAALRSAQDAGVPVWRSSRCAFGPVRDAGRPVLPSVESLSPWQARVEMQLQLLRAASGGPDAQTRVSVTSTLPRVALE